MDQPSSGSVFVDTEVPAKAQRRSFTASYKLDILGQADRCSEPGEIGACCGGKVYTLPTWPRGATPGRREPCRPCRRSVDVPPRNLLGSRRSAGSARRTPGFARSSVVRRR